MHSNGTLVIFIHNFMLLLRRLKLNMVFSSFHFCLSSSVCPGDAIAQSVERATTGKKVLGSIPAVATRSPLVGSVSE